MGRQQRTGDEMDCDVHRQAVKADPGTDLLDVGEGQVLVVSHGPQFRMLLSSHILVMTWAALLFQEIPARLCCLTMGLKLLGPTTVMAALWGQLACI